ncbi:host cell division inhibitor Icd-like protein [Avibacterium paragallinarum]|uniref:host cell division inhibitor Icd-like protein n=1 Tax=Avibacterium paragallinarum TaxID=728 RepID=UPI00397BAE28
MNGKTSGAFPSDQQGKAPSHYLTIPSETMTNSHSNKKPLTSAGNLSYFITALSKSAEPANSNDKTLAYECTPFNACFFMRSTNTPQERPALHESRERLSMVACYGKGFALCCVPMFAVLQPVTRYRPKDCKLHAVTSEIINIGVTAMIYKFLLLGTRLHISTYAQSEAAARQFLNLPRESAVFIARIKGVQYV